MVEEVGDRLHGFVSGQVFKLVIIAMVTQHVTERADTTPLRCALDIHDIMDGGSDRSVRDILGDFTH